MKDVEYRGFKVLPVTEYHVWKDGNHYFVGTLQECIRFLDKNPTGILNKQKQERMKE